MFLRLRFRLVTVRRAIRINVAAMVLLISLRRKRRDESRFLRWRFRLVTVRCAFREIVVTMVLPVCLRRKRRDGPRFLRWRFRLVTVRCAFPVNVAGSSFARRQVRQETVHPSNRTKALPIALGE
jgi:hypothetical protein